MAPGYAERHLAGRFLEAGAIALGLQRITVPQADG
jgi:hypothetical protein